MNFDEWYANYPRKVAKAAALKAWNRLEPCARDAAAAALPAHLRHWRLACTDWCYVPHPATWLNQRRFEDELQDPVQACKWWETDQGTLEHGKAVGMLPRPGEEMAGYRQRLRAA